MDIEKVCPFLNIGKRIEKSCKKAVESIMLRIQIK
jgi:hypothetical protein|tara:strand:- start:2022 stop:2126 length:105 start_codon:yes stop_codon:yes gene_type:complete